MRRAGKVDANQAAITHDLRKLGYSVWITSNFGQGAPDLVVGKDGKTYLFEVKDGSLPPSKRQLTPDEKEFKASWKGHYAVIETTEEALREMVTKVSSPKD